MSHPGVRGINGAILVLIGVLVLSGCAGSDTDSPPKWVQSPPQHLSCREMAKPQLMVDVIRSADLSAPDPDETSVTLDSAGASFECRAVGGDQLGLSVGPIEDSYLASGFSPPDPLLVPIGKLPGFVTHDWSWLYVSCTRESGTVTLESSVSIMPRLTDNEVGRSFSHFCGTLRRGSRWRD